MQKQTKSKKDKFIITPELEKFDDSDESDDVSKDKKVPMNV